KEGWQTLTNKEERQRSMQLIAQYGEKGIGRNSALLYGSLFGATSDFIQDPEETFSAYNKEVAKPFITNTLGVSKNSIGYKALKYVGVRTETAIGVATNLGKGVVQGSYFLGETIGTSMSPYFIEGSRKLGLFGLDNDDVYNYALNDASSRINNVKKQWSAVPGAMASSFFTTFNAKNAYNFLFNPDLSLHDSFTYGESATNTFFTMYATKNLATAAGNKIKAGYTSLKNTTSNFMDNMGLQPIAAGGYGNLAGNSAINSAIASSTSRVGSTAKVGLVNSIGRGVNKGTGKATGKGFNSFNDAKKALGSPGKGNQWHHIVEQSQIQKSGFSATQIQNTNNLIAVDKATHAKISGYYNTKSFDFTGGKSVRDWLAGQSYQTQYDFGINVLKRFEVMK
ncbi:MAG: hypothetical protein PHI24_12960, partial [Desulfitobacteriaceae bacterium]|nr:hypothetical protein [Desulfitobacteriaceae bacterium]